MASDPPLFGQARAGPVRSQDWGTRGGPTVSLRGFPGHSAAGPQMPTRKRASRGNRRRQRRARLAESQPKWRRAAHPAAIGRLAIHICSSNAARAQARLHSEIAGWSADATIVRFTPRSAPQAVVRWTSRLRWMRTLDAVVGSVCGAASVVSSASDPDRLRLSLDLKPRRWTRVASPSHPGSSRASQVARCCSLPLRPALVSGKRRYAHGRPGACQRVGPRTVCTFDGLMACR